MKKVFISSGGFRNKKATEVIKNLLKEKIYDVELSGGKYLKKIDIDQIIKQKNKIQLRPHNYFPPPKKKLVINLASQNLLIMRRSIAQIKNSILLSKKLGSKYFSFHAGFRIDPDVKNLGKTLNGNLLPKNHALKIFKKNILDLNKFAKKNKIKILIENNVVTKNNFIKYGSNPLLLTNPKDIIDFFKKLPKSIGLLLDVAHLKVSANTEKFSFKGAIRKLNSITKGYHLSDNDSIADTNNKITKKSSFIKLLNKNLDYYTLEVYTENLKLLLRQKKFIEKILNYEK
jgi:sugar phosphate isomerase/epimerase